MGKKGHGGGGGHDAAGGLRWLLTYADLITLLLVFFIVVAAISNPEKKKIESLGVAFTRIFGVFPAGSKTQISVAQGSGKGLLPFSRPSNDVSLKLTSHLEAVGTKGLNVETKKKNLVIRVSGLLLFGANSADLLPTAQDVLDRVGSFLNLIPNKFVIQGNTDAAPSTSPRYPTNWELSTARALTVGHYLMDKYRTDPSRITISGRADQEALRPEQLEGTEDVDAQNRRVDIIIDLEGT